MIESNGPGEPFHDMVSERLWEERRQGLMQCELIPFATTGTTKPQMINALAIAFEREQISILDDPVMVNEFEAYEIKPSAGGMHERFGAPESGHDDCVMACALAWTEVELRLRHGDRQQPTTVRPERDRDRSFWTAKGTDW